jgi:DNA-binding response OmpR family regulator
MERILVIEDDPTLLETLEYNLSRQEYEVHTAADGAAGLETARQVAPDLIVLDIMLPGLDGFEICRIVRQEMNVPILMLTARTEEIDKIVGLEVGADDYMTKPFSPRELVARVKAVLRRGRGSSPTDDELLRFEGLDIDLARREATVDSSPIELTSLEFDLLAALTSAPGRVFTRRQLIERVWGWDFFGDHRIVDVHIRNIRKALGDPADAPRFIGTVRGVGYKFLGNRA